MKLLSYCNNRFIKFILTLIVTVLPYQAYAKSQAIPFLDLVNFKARMAVDCQKFPHSRVVNVHDTTGLATALYTAIPGDLILVADGTYKGNFVTGPVSGTATSPITVCGSNNAILTADNVRRGFVLFAKDVDYWNIAGISLTKAQKGIVLDHTNNVDINSVTISEVGNEGIRIRRNSTNNKVENSSISNTGRANLIFGVGIGIGSYRLEVRNDHSDSNQIINNYVGPGVTANNIDAREYTSKGVIDSNYFDGKDLLAVMHANAWVNIKGNNYTVTNNFGTNSPKDGFQTHVVAKGWGNFNVFGDNTLNVNAKGYGIRIHLISSLTDRDDDYEDDNCTDNRTDANKEKRIIEGKDNVVKCSNTAVGAASGLSNIECQK